MKNVEVQIAYCVEEAVELKKQGYIPVECVYGSQSVVDCYEMDHHNDYWNLEPVSLRAYRDHYGVAREDPRFVVGPKADLDATFAIAALAGHVPHPKHSWAKNCVANARDLTQLAHMIARRDDEPLFVLPVGRDNNANVIACWEFTKGKMSSAQSYYVGVNKWWILTAKTKPDQLKNEVRKYKQNQIERINLVKQCQVDSVGNGIGFVSSEIWGFDQWLSNFDMIVSHHSKRNRVLLSVKNKQRAIDLFGKSGLLELRNHISGDWGGRASLLVPARGQSYQYKDARFLSEQICSFLNG